MESKRKNIYIVIFVITTIIAACGAMYFYLESRKANNENNSLLKAGQEKDSVIEQKNAEIKELKDNSNTGETTPTDNESSKEDYSKVTSYNPSKSKVKEENIKYTGQISHTQNSTVATVKQDGTVYLSRKVNGIDKQLQVSGLSGKAKDAIAFGFVDGNSWYVVVLMEDGTVEITEEIYGAGNKNELISKGKIKNVSNISQIFITSGTGEELNEDFGHNITHTRNTAGALDKDGNFYDLMTAYLK